MLNFTLILIVTCEFLLRRDDQTRLKQRTTNNEIQTYISTKDKLGA